MRCNSSKPDIPVILSGTLKFLAGVVGVALFKLFFPFFAFLFCGWLDGIFCSNATLIRSMASSVGTYLKIKAHGYNIVRKLLSFILHSFDHCLIGFSLGSLPVGHMLCLSVLLCVLIFLYVLSFVRWVGWLVGSSFVRSFVRSSVRPFVRPSVRSSVRSDITLFIRSLLFFICSSVSLSFV